VAQTGIARIDQLLNGLVATPIAAGEPDRDAVGVVQDLLRGHGFSELPGLLGSARGVFGPLTTAAVEHFQTANSLAGAGTVDQSTLQAMVDVPAIAPSMARGYLALALDFASTPLLQIVSITSQFEGAGRFTAINKNTDRAGLSFGAIQWAQKPGRLNELLRAYQAAGNAAFVQIFGDGDAALAAGLIQHTALPDCGVDAQGRTTDSTFDLTSETWVSRFLAAGRNRALQSVQVNAALDAFQKSLARLQTFAPQIQSERGVAFMLDLANQHGDGGAQRIFQAVVSPGLSEPELLEAIEQESVARVRRQFGDGSITDSTQSRREAFRTTPLLSDDPFAAPATGATG
jgi:peptidoglycan hydrolase-like protein with peptidoglycan-binding domain